MKYPLVDRIQGKMSTSLLSPIHIHKLGHPIEEIRTRALHSVWSKYNLDLVDDSNFENSKLLLMKLIEWFNFETHPYEEKVFKLIIRVLGQINCIGPTKDTISPKEISAKIDEIRNKIDGKYSPLIEEIKDCVRKIKDNIATELNEQVCIFQNNIEDMVSEKKQVLQNTCVFPLQQFPPIEIEIGNRCVQSLKEQTFFHNSEHPASGNKFKTEKSPHCKKNELRGAVINATKIEYFPWQLLYTHDSAVLPSVYDGLRYIDNIDSILQSCQFYIDILVQDFPVEILLQRPLLICTFFELLQCNEPAVCLQATKCLLVTVKQLSNRLQIFSDASLIHSKEYYKDITMSKEHNYDENNFHRDETQIFPNVHTYTCEIVADFEKEKEVLHLKSQQYSFSEVCFLILSQSIPNISKEKTLEEYNLIFELVLETFSCLIRNLTSMIWCNKQFKDRIYKVFNLFYSPIKYHKTKNSIIYITIIHAIIKILDLLQPPSEECQKILPHSIELELIECISDYIFILLYPYVNSKIKLAIDRFSGQKKRELLEIHETLYELRNSMKSAVEFLKGRNELNSKVKILICAQNSLPCLEFHRNFQFIQDFVKICLLNWSEKELNLGEINVRKSILLKLLSHNDLAVKLATYKELHIHIIRYLGVDEEAKSKFQCPGNKFGFLFDSDILTEMICHGINSDHTEVKNITSEIFIHLLKGRIFFSDSDWKSLMKAMSSCLCLLQCFADKTTPFGRCVLKMLDPDISKAISLSFLDLLRGNLRLLFSKNNLIREEALLRLFWLLAKDDPEKLKLPRLSLLRGINLSSVCSSVEPEELSGISQSFFSADSLSNVMEILISDEVEPKVRRSALTQLSVMLEHSHLHGIFLEQNGLPVILDIFENCLIEKEYQNYPDSAIPIMKILKHICLDNPSVRSQLSLNIDLYYCILRGLLLFNSERQSRQQGVELLCLLLYNECIINVKSEKAIMCKISVPQILFSKICLPFLVRVHWRYSQYAEPSQRESVMLREKSASLLRVYWNIEWFGSISQILALKNNDLKEEIFSPSLPTDMMLKTEDLTLLKNCSVAFGMKQTLFDIQNATSHESVIASLHSLNSYILLYDLGRSLDDDDGLKSTMETTAAIINLKWTSTFGRFLTSMPSCEDDEVLLNQVIHTLRLILRTLGSEDLYKWMENLLTDELENLPNVLKCHGESNSAAIYRELSRALSGLIKDTITSNPECLPNKWLLYVKLITKELKLNKKNEIHNVAHVDCLLSVLADITGRLTQSNVQTSDFYKETITRSMETIVAFHCTKYSLSSFFGTNIIKNCLAILNNILDDTRATVEGWECLWHQALSKVIWHTERPNYSWFLSLWFFRDPIVRAFALQLISGFSLTSQSCDLLLEKLHIEFEYLWNEGFKILLDDNECNLVREKAALLLSNLICHGSVKAAKDRLQNLMETTFYDKLGDIIDRVQVDPNDSERMESYMFQRYSGLLEDGFDVIVPVSTPSLVSAICNLLINIMFLRPEIGDIIIRTGLLDILKRIFNDAPETCFKYKDTECFIELIKMYKTCCIVITKCMTTKTEHCISVRHCQQFVNSLFNLMNYSIFDSNLNRVLEERNELWCSILGALSVILTEPLGANNDTKSLQKDGFKALNCALVENGIDCFISAIYVAASSKSCELRFRCLHFLTNLFGIEARTTSQFTITDIFDRQILSCAVEHAEKFCWKGLSISYKLDLNFGRRMSDILLQTYKITNSVNKITLKATVADALGSLLSVCKKAQNYCLEEGLAEDLAESLRTTFVKLSTENVDFLKKLADTKRVDTFLHEIEISYMLLTNLMTGNENLKSYIASNGLASLIHKLWCWCSVKNSLLIKTLKLLCTYTLNSDPACRSLALDKSCSMIGLRKPHGGVTLIQTLMLYIEKEMNLVLKNQTGENIQLAFQLLENCCRATECRCLMAKGTFIRFFANFYHGYLNKRRSQSEFLMELWFNFFVIFTSHQEGQLALPRNQDALEVIIDAASTTSILSQRKKALKILRNLSFHQLNRVQLLGHYKFLTVMIESVKSVDNEEIDLALQAIWGLICNSQKGKIIIRNTGLEDVLKEVTKKLKLCSTGEELQSVDVVSQILINK